MGKNFGLIFRSLIPLLKIYFELVFMNIKKTIQIFFLHVVIQFFQHHLLKKAILLLSVLDFLVRVTVYVGS